MVVINEWLPNPQGSDVENEWIELLNTSAAPVDLSGWRIENTGGGLFRLPGYRIASKEFLLLPRATTKLSLRNTDGKLSLYNSGGRLVDVAEFRGTAPEGKSVSRSGDAFLFSEATPGTENKFAQTANLIQNSYPMGSPINYVSQGAHVVEIALAVGALLTLLIFFGIKKNDYLSKLIFGGDEEIR